MAATAAAYQRITGQHPARANGDAVDDASIVALIIAAKNGNSTAADTLNTLREVNGQIGGAVGWSTVVGYPNFP